MSAGLDLIRWGERAWNCLEVSQPRQQAIIIAMVIDEKQQRAAGCDHFMGKK